MTPTIDKLSKRPIVTVHPFTGDLDELRVSVQAEGVARLLGTTYALFPRADGRPGFQTIKVTV